uniref:OB domain-containing protein n=1 Tax=Oryza glumipatula TaxID=40148 RepID=A0A0D9ZTC0_9ORYZ
MAAAAELSRGAVAAMSRMEQGLRPVLQVTDVRPAAGRYLVALFDGTKSGQGVLVASMAHLVRARAIRAGTIIRCKWTIKARVTAKSGLQHLSNDRGEAKFFDFDLLDEQGGEMLAKCFSSAAEKFYGLIEVDKVYLISRGLVKPAQEPFNSDYELALDASASVEVCSSDVI